MYTSYWDMQFNPFEKTLPIKKAFISADFTEAITRLDYLKKCKGIGLFTGAPGTGKSFVLRAFRDSLNPSLHKVIYLPLSTITNMEFFRGLALEFGLQPAFRKIDLFREIQSAIAVLALDRKITPVIILDEAQYLNSKILNDLKILMNFDFDSLNYAVLILTGTSLLNSTLSLKNHEALAQRIVINYLFQGLSSNDVRNYINSQMQLCGASPSVFPNETVEALAHSCNGSIRKLNSLLIQCLIIGFNKKEKMISTDIVFSANSDLSLS